MFWKSLCFERHVLDVLTAEVRNAEISLSDVPLHLPPSLMCVVKAGRPHLRAAANELGWLSGSPLPTFLTFPPPCSLRGFCPCSRSGLTVHETLPEALQFTVWCLKVFSRCTGNNLQERDGTNSWRQQFDHLFQLSPWMPMPQHSKAIQLCSEAGVSQQTAQQCFSSKNNSWKSRQEGGPVKYQPYPPGCASSRKRLR